MTEAKEFILSIALATAFVVGTIALVLHIAGE